MKSRLKTVVKYLSGIILVVALGLVFMPSADAKAVLQEEAVAWAFSQLGNSIDFDKSSGEEDVDLIMAYYDYLGFRPVYGRANEYDRGGIFAPAGWAYVDTPDLGDIAITNAGDNGHVAIVVDLFGTDSYGVAEQGYDDMEGVQFRVCYEGDFEIFLRPDYVIPMDILYKADMIVESETNNSPSTANEVPLHKGVAGVLESGGDIDYFSFNIPSNGKVWVEFEHEYSLGTPGFGSSVGDTDWHLDIVALQNKSEKDVFSYQWVESTTGQLTSPEVGLAEGSYFIKVYRVGSNADDYTFTICFETSPNWEKEGNDTKETANSISTNFEVNGGSDYGYDQDWYTFSVPYDGSIWVSFEHDFIDSDSYIWRSYVVSESGSNIKNLSWKGSAKKAEESPKISIDEGKYYFRVDCEEKSVTEAYRFIISYIPDEEAILKKEEEKRLALEEEERKRNETKTKEQANIERFQPRRAETSQKIKYDDITYTVCEDDQLVVTGIKKGSKKTKIVIPESIKLYGVTYEVAYIGTKAFAKNKNIKSVTINAFLEYIGPEAFAGCTALKTLTINGDVGRIAGKAFYKCKKLKLIEVKAKSLEFVGKGAFKDIYKEADVYMYRNKRKTYKRLLQEGNIPRTANLKIFEDTTT